MSLALENLRGHYKSAVIWLHTKKGSLTVYVMQGGSDICRWLSKLASQLLMSRCLLPVFCWSVLSSAHMSFGSLVDGFLGFGVFFFCYAQGTRGQWVSWAWGGQRQWVSHSPSWPSGEPCKNWWVGKAGGRTERPQPGCKCVRPEGGVSCCVVSSLPSTGKLWKESVGGTLRQWGRDSLQQGLVLVGGSVVCFISLRWPEGWGAGQSIPALWSLPVGAWAWPTLVLSHPFSTLDWHTMVGLKRKVSQSFLGKERCACKAPGVGNPCHTHSAQWGLFLSKRGWLFCGLPNPPYRRACPASLLGV